MSTISSVISSAAVAAGNAPTAAAQAVRPQVQPPSNNSGDTLTLTVAEQVYQLYNQGQQVSQIATSLSLPVSAVNNYLGITPSGG